MPELQGDLKMISTKHIFASVAAVALLFTLLLSSFILETNDVGYVQVKQAAGTGHMSVRTTPGVYPQMFAAIHTYKISDNYDFTSESDAIPVRFGGDGSTGKVFGQARYKLPIDEKSILLIHSDFRSEDAVQNSLVRQAVLSAVIQTATMFTAEEVYSTRRSDFVAMVNEQIKNGIYATTYTESYIKDEDGNVSIRRQVMPQRRADGSVITSESSIFKRYNVELVQFIVNNIEFDDATNELIKKRKEADQQKVVAKANAERAKQDTITVEAQGKARVAEAEASALVQKKTAVIAAEREKEVAEQRALQAEEEKKAIIARGEADAEAARLKVAAGLTPLDKANIDMKTAIGVAEKLAQVKFPQMMIIGGSGNGQSAMNPFDAVGLESFIKISKSLTPETEK